MIRSLAIACDVVIGVSGCVTSGLDTPEARRASNIVMSNCAIDSGPLVNRSSRKFQEKVQIFGIDYSDDGWIRFDAVTEGIRDLVYFDPDKEQVVCGSRNWREKQIIFRQISSSDYKQKFKGYWGDSEPLTRSTTATTPQKVTSSGKTASRPIAVNWEGVEDLFIGTASIEGGGRSGVISVPLPDAEGSCSGNYTFGDNKEGIWAVACSNGLSANGTMKGLGAGKGSRGEGKDNNGRKVVFTVGAK
jgi:hypothetical protein